MQTLLHVKQNGVKMRFLKYRKDRKVLSTKDNLEMKYKVKLAVDFLCTNTWVPKFMGNVN